MPEAQPQRGGAIWKWVLPSLLAVLLLYFAVRGVEWGRVWSSIAHAHVEWCLAVIASTSISSFLRSLRWRVLLNARANFDVLTVFWANMSGYLGNIPACTGRRTGPHILSSAATPA